MRTINDIKQIRSYYLFVNEIKQSVSETLGIMPFLTIGNLFVGSSAQISSQLMIREKMTTSYFIVQWSEFVILAVVHLILIIVLTKIQDKENQMHKTIVRKIFDRLIDANFGNDFKVYLILEEMKIIGKDTEFNAWNMFNIDKKLVLSFLSFIVPFVVMITQFNH